MAMAEAQDIKLNLESTFRASAHVQIDPLSHWVIVPKQTQIVPLTKANDMTKAEAHGSGKSYFTGRPCKVT